MSRKESSKHEFIKQEIKKRPYLIGIDNVCFATEEVALYDEKRRLQRMPDLLFLAEKLDERTEWILVEVKSRDKVTQYAKHQVEDARQYFLDHFGIDCKTIIAFMRKDGTIGWVQQTKGGKGW